MSDQLMAGREMDALTLQWMHIDRDLDGWHPSTMMCEAWEIVGWLIQRGFNVELYADDDSVNVSLRPPSAWVDAVRQREPAVRAKECTIQGIHYVDDGSQPSAPLAICRALADVVHEADDMGYDLMKSVSHYGWLTR